MFAELESHDMLWSTGAQPHFYGQIEEVPQEMVISGEDPDGTPWSIHLCTGFTHIYYTEGSACYYLQMNRAISATPEINAWKDTLGK